MEIPPPSPAETRALNANVEEHYMESTLVGVDPTSCDCVRRRTRRNAVKRVLPSGGLRSYPLGKARAGSQRPVILSTPPGSRAEERKTFKTRAKPVLEPLVAKSIPPRLQELTARCLDLSCRSASLTVQPGGGQAQRQASFALLVRVCSVPRQDATVGRRCIRHCVGMAVLWHVTGAAGP